MMIRTATPTDAEALLRIYAPYVEHTAITFEYDVPSVEEFRQRIAHTLERYPYIVAEQDGRIVGYAYAGVFKDRAAYNHCVETSIYVDKNCQRQGVGSALYQELEARLRQQGIINVNACISWIDTPNEYLTHQSPEFHARQGYAKVAHFHKCGYKFNRWFDMIWMEKMIGDHLESPSLTESPSTEISIREARPEDCEFVALGICMALHMIPDGTLRKAIAKICLREDVLYSYRHTLIAWSGTTPVGLCLCYDGGLYHEMRKTTFPLFDDIMGGDAEHEQMDLDNAEDEAVAGEYYVDSLSVLPEWRRKGIGGLLLKSQMQRARELGFSKATLLVDPENPDAQRVYRRQGFEDYTVVYAFGQNFLKWKKDL